jgi:hypothetical protein
MKTAELTGAALDYWVAKADCLECIVETRETTNGPEKVCWLVINGVPYFGERPYSPSTNWSSGGPIIEREKIPVWWGGDMEWHAALATANPDGSGGIDVRAGYADTFIGPTPLIAAMRAFVASRFGEEVPDA